MKSKRSYRSRAKEQKSRYYLIVSLILALILLKWGFPLAVRIIGKTGGSMTNESINEDFLPPQTPVLSALPEATNSGRLKLEGYTEAEASLSVWIGDKLKLTDKSDKEGDFVLWLDLEEGENEIIIKAKDEADNESHAVTKKIVWDTEPLELEVSTPKDGNEYFGKQNQTISIGGEINKENCRLTVNGLYTSVDSDGVFSQKLRLSEGDNEIEVKANDPAGNEVVIKLKVRYVN